MNTIDRVACDVLVIGGGGAGCRAAIAAASLGSNVILANKFPLGRSGTTITAMITYTGTMGILGVSPDDNPDVLFWDVFRGGRYLGNQDLIEVFARGARNTVLELESWGVKWDKVGDKYDAAKLPGHSYARGNHVDSITGLAIQRALTKQVQSNDAIRVVDNFMITKLLVDAGRVSGAVGLDVYSGKLTIFRAGAVILATGGAGRLFKITSMPEDARGDGFALAYEAGATLVDMEFQQFYPSCLVHPTSIRGVMVPGAIVYQQGASLLNSHGERFMHKYDPENQELATRDMLSRGIALEVAAGNGGKYGGVFVDCSMIPDLVSKHPKSFGLFKAVGMKSFDKIEVAPGLHFSIGGVRINQFCESSVPGLYAAGEVAAGLHGANRCGGNALAETQVFGKIAGEQASAFASHNGQPAINPSDVRTETNRLISMLESEPKGNPRELMTELQGIMYESAGLIRSEQSLNETLDHLERLRSRAARLGVPGGTRYNLAWIDAVDIQNMIQVAEIICRSALERKESRGAHYRSDYPVVDDSYLKHFCVNRVDKGIQVTSVPRIITRPEGESK